METSEKKTETIIKVLEFTSDPFTYSGQEMFILNMYKNFQNKNVRYTFCTPFYTDNKEFLELLKINGDRHYSFNYNYNSKNRRMSVVKAMKQVLKDNKFDVVHIHSGGLFILYTLAKLAKKNGVEKVIVHSHQTGSKSLKYTLMKVLTDFRFKKYVDRFFACSDLAAEWKFPRDIINNKDYKVINNGINVSKFTFSEDIRNKYRSELGIKKDEIVILNVGRFFPEKNHKFMVEIVKTLKEKNVDFKFIFVGNGELKELICSKIDEISCRENCMFFERRNDVAELLMASDVFVLPSLFEGFPITLIEAQATGIQTICSDKITREVCITDLCNQMSINEIDVNNWVEKIIQISKLKVKRDSYSQVVAACGYDEKTSAKVLEDEYLN